MDIRHPFLFKTLFFSLLLCSGQLLASAGEECEGCLPFAPVIMPQLDTRATMAMLMLNPSQENTVTEQYAYAGADSILSFSNDDDSGSSGTGSSAVTAATGRTDESRERLLYHVRALRQDENIAERMDAAALRLLEPFMDGLNEDNALPENEKMAIICAALDFSCGEINSPAAVDYMAYLDARRSFYAADYERARQGFEVLTASAQPWVKETAQYNLIRVSLRQALPLTEYGEADFSQRNREVAAKALDAINRYLQLYPNGRYAGSAEGLKRRAYWLMDDTAAMIAAYQPDIERAQRGELIPANLLYELDRYAVFPSSLYNFTNEVPSPATGQEENPVAHVTWTVPLVASSQVLMRLRPGSEKAVPLPDLLAHEQEFQQKGYGELFRLLKLSTQFYGDKNPQAVVDGTKDWEALSTQSSYLAYSLLVLRAYALEAMKNWDASAALWAHLRNMPTASPLFRSYVEKAQVVNFELSGDLFRIFAKDSPVTNADYRNAVLKHSASAPVLEQVIASEHTSPEDKSQASATLLQKSLTPEDATNLLRYYRQYSPLLGNKNNWCPADEEQTARSTLDYECKDTLKAMESLASGKPTPDARLCHTNWLRACTPDRNNSSHSGLDQNELHTQADRFPVPGQFAKDSFPDHRTSATNLYQQVLDDPKANANQRAFALYQSLQCFYHAGGANIYGYCAGLGQMEKYPVEHRKRWFRELKTKYAKTPWAEAQRVYW